MALTEHPHVHEVSNANDQQPTTNNQQPTTGNRPHDHIHRDIEEQKRKKEEETKKKKSQKRNYDTSSGCSGVSWSCINSRGPLMTASGVLSDNTNRASPVGAQLLSIQLLAA
jgi:hypothetical protein